MDLGPGGGGAKYVLWADVAVLHAKGDVLEDGEAMVEVVVLDVRGVLVPINKQIGLLKK
jgi:hypothetical protein